GSVISIRLVRLGGECHGLAPWRITLAATRRDDEVDQDATGSPRGESRWQLQEGTTKLTRMPRACPVEGHVFYGTFASVSLHGTSPWHSQDWLKHFVAASVSDHGASPWHPQARHKLFVAASVSDHGASPWH